MELGQLWQNRIKQANEYYDIWANKYQVSQLEEYYYGHQWEMDGDGDSKHQYNPYTSNRIFVAIDVKMPGLLFQDPVFSVEPRPSKQEWDESNSSERAQLREDVINYFSTSGFLGLAEEAELAILDAFFRFGVMEVGYSADWIDNPDRGKPLLTSDNEEVTNGEGEIIKQPPRIPQQERIFVKRIPSNRFRVSSLDHQKLKRCDWFGYWEYARTDDITTNPNFEVAEFDIVSTHQSEFGSPEALRDELDQQVEQGKLTKLWKIWDVRSRQKLYFADGVTKLLRKTPFKRLPIFPLKFRERLLGFYPLPVTYNWMAPQDELNETRESARVHRRRFQRKYITNEGANHANPNTSIAPMPNADLGAQHFEQLAGSVQDFDTIAGTPVTSRQERSKGTATEASIEDKRATIRESRDRVLIAKWLSDIGKEILLQAKEKLTQPFWIKLSQASEDDFSQIEEIEERWEQINSEELGDEDFDVNISVSSLSPLTQDQEKRKFIEFLSILTQFPMISMSPLLVQEAANKVGYRNSKVLGIFQKFAQAQQLALMAKAEQSGGGGEGGAGGGQLGQRTVAQNQPQDLEEVRNELGNLTTQVQ
jgi:hypothetical protein